MKLDHNNTYKLHCLIWKKKLIIAQLVFLFCHKLIMVFTLNEGSVCVFSYFAEFDKSIRDLITHEVAAEGN